MAGKLGDFQLHFWLQQLCDRVFPGDFVCVYDWSVVQHNVVSEELERQYKKEKLESFFKKCIIYINIIKLTNLVYEVRKFNPGFKIVVFFLNREYPLLGIPTQVSVI